MASTALLVCVALIFGAAVGARITWWLVVNAIRFSTVVGVHVWECDDAECKQHHVDLTLKTGDGKPKVWTFRIDDALAKRLT